MSTIGIAFVVLSLRQGQAGLHATRRALGHARTANKIAREAANMQLRPYLAFVIESNEKRDHPVERGRVYEFPFKNYGNTPALNLKVWFESILVQRPIGDLNIVLKHPPYYGGSLAPGATGYDLVDAPDDLNFIADIAAGWVLVCRTRVEYDIPTGGSDAIDQYMVLSAEGLSTGSFTTLTDYERQRTESG